MTLARTLNGSRRLTGAAARTATATQRRVAHAARLARAEVLLDVALHGGVLWSAEGRDGRRSRVDLAPCRDPLRLAHLRAYVEDLLRGLDA